MTIYSADPAAETAKLRQALTALGDGLRKQGAEVETVEHDSSSLHTTILMVTMRGSLTEAAATSAKLKRIGEKTGGAAYGTLLTPEKTGVSEGEYRVALAYQVSKPPRAGKRRRLA
jgi:hypothetical protein